MTQNFLPAMVIVIHSTSKNYLLIHKNVAWGCSPKWQCCDTANHYTFLRIVPKVADEFTLSLQYGAATVIGNNMRKVVVELSIDKWTNSNRIKRSVCNKCNAPPQKKTHKLTLWNVCITFTWSDYIAISLKYSSVYTYPGYGRCLACI